MSTQNFGTMKLGLEVNVDEANKYFDRQNKHRFQTSDEFMFSANHEEEEKIDTSKQHRPHNYDRSRFMERYNNQSSLS